MPSITRNEGVSGSSPLIGFQSPSQIHADALEAAGPRATTPPLLARSDDPLTVWTGRLLLAGCVLLIAALLAVSAPDDSDGSARADGPTPPTLTAAPSDEARTRPQPPSRWVRATVSHYGTCTYVNVAQGCDGYLGERTACGKTVTTRSWFVAALKPDLARCGLKLTLLYRGRTYRVTVQDRGAWRDDNRALDAAPGLHRSMGRPELARVYYRKGWS